MIIGIKEGDKVVIGYANVENLAQPCEVRKHPENCGVWAVGGNPHTIMGYDVATPESDAFKYTEELFAGRIDYNSLIRSVIPGLLEFKDQHRYLTHNKSKHSDYLIAQEDRLYYFAGKYFNVICDDVVALGMDEGILYGALAASAALPAKDRILRAFRASKDIRGNGNYTVTIMDTLTERRETIWQK